MRTSVLAVVLCAMMTGGTAVAERQSGCSFAISHAVGSPEVLGGNEAAGRASVMAQPDSPLAILRADLGGVELTTGTGSFSRIGRHVLDVKNVSDKVITHARVMVRVGFGPSSGVGSGTKLARSLQPGEQARVEWKSGTGRGTDPTAEEVSVVALVEEVQLPGCTYRPSEAWPTRDVGSGTER
jgi:hypothetical protein